MNRLFSLKFALLIPVIRRFHFKKFYLLVLLLTNLAFAGQCGVKNIIGITYFDVRSNQNKIEIKFTVEGEKGINEFYLERSFDDQNYTRIALIPAKKTNESTVDYQYTDDIKGFNGGPVYYRIQVVDADGLAKQSDVKLVRVKEATDKGPKIIAYPNPVLDQLSLGMPSSWRNKTVVIQVFNSFGAIVKQSVIKMAGPTETISLNSLPRDFYILKASCEQQVTQEKIKRN
ncbi:MAG: T9SS type A sorting domain-containing protein [Flavisolibacter sp.]